MALIINKKYKQRRSDVDLVIGGLYKTKLGKIIRLTKWIDIVNLPKEQDKIVEDLNRLLLGYYANTYSLDDGTETVIWYDEEFRDIEGRSYWRNGDSISGEANVKCLSESSELDQYKRVINESLDVCNNIENIAIILFCTAFASLLILPFYLFGS